MPELIQNNGDAKRDMVVSFLTIRKAVGLLGMSYPIVLALGNWLPGHCPCLKDSVSAYYYTNMSSYFSGALCAVGLFMFTYKGYSLADEVLSKAGSVFALCIVFFPSDLGGSCACCNVIFRPQNTFSDTAHFISAAFFFITMAGMSLFLFTKTDPEVQPTKQKLQRNKVYKVCGYIMLGAMALIPALKIKAIPEVVFNYKPEFWLEFIVLASFGFSWLVKGETLLKDK